MSNVTMGVRPNINLYGKAAISCSVAIPSLAIYFYFCPSTEAKYGKDAGLLSNCGARDCLITLQQWMKPCSARSCMQHGACSCQEVYVREALI